jgi:protocatechuate 3,4-dioxygenase beta subunit
MKETPMTMHFPRESAKVHPPSLFPFYTSTVKRAPKRPLIILPHTETELTGPAYGHEVVQPGDSDLTTQHEGTPIGQRTSSQGGCSTKTAGQCRIRSSRFGRRTPRAAMFTSMISMTRRSTRTFPALAAW